MTSTPFSSIAFVFISSVIGSFGAVFLKMGAKHLQRSLLNIISWQSFAGVAFYLLSSVFFVLGVRKGELSVLYPMVSLGYIWTLIWSRWFFREPITPPKYLALSLILVGICLIGFGAH